MLKFNLKSYSMLCSVEIMFIFINLFLLKYGNFKMAAVTTFILVILRGAYAIFARMKFLDGIIVFLTGRLIIHFVSFYVIKITRVAGLMSLETSLYIFIMIVLIDVISYVFINGLKFIGRKFLE